VGSLRDQASDEMAKVKKTTKHPRTKSGEEITLEIAD
jgi:hypothetical protein